MIDIILAQFKNIFFILPILIISTILLFRQAIWAKKSLCLLTGNSRSKLFINFSMNKKLFKIILLLLSLSFLSIALLRPQWSKEEQIVSQEARDLIIAIDISKSMLAQDFKPNRLEFAKNKIKEIINRLNSERIGLIVFSGEAFCQCPLTSDLSAIFNFLDHIDTETISSGSTSISSAISKAIELFSNIDKDRKNKLLLIFTDGEDFSDNLSSIKDKAKSLDLKIFNFGVGTTSGAPIPIFDNTGNIKDYKRDKKNQIIISKLAEDTLSNLSNETGAEYIKATQDFSDVDKLIKKINSFEKEKIEDKKVNSHKDRYYYFALVSFVLLGIEWLI